MFDPRACECVTGRQLSLRSPGSSGSGKNGVGSEVPEPSPLVNRDLVRPRDTEKVETFRRQTEKEEEEMNRYVRFTVLNERIRFA